MDARTIRTQMAADLIADPETEKALLGPRSVMRKVGTAAAAVATASADDRAKA